MKSKDLFKLHRNDVSMTLGEASIEHPLSIHSASIGTSWKPAGNTAIIRCMAAMFVMLFTLGVGNMWGTYYGTGRVVAVRFGGDDANFGQVGCKTTTGTNGVNYDGGTYAVDFTNYSNTQSYSSTSTTKVYIVCFAQEVENSGYTFAGWYTDESCAEGYEAPDTGISGWGQTSTQYAYYWGIRKDIPHTGSNTSKNNAEVLATLYAKFVKGSTANKFQTKLTVSTESTSKGVIDVSKTGVDPWGWGVYQYDVNSEHPLTRGKDTKTITGDQEETEETSTAQTYYVYALPLRGYEFSSWTTGTGVTLTPDYYCDEGAWCNTSAFDVSVSTDNTKTNGVYGYTGTLTANFVALEETFGFSVEKEAGTGSATVAYANWEYDSSSKVARKHTYDLTALSLSDTKKTYSGLYSTDEIILTATPEDGFVFVGWYVNSSIEQNVLLSDEATATATLYEDGMTFIPVFAPNMDNLDVSDADNFLVGTTLCQTFEQALTAATQGQFKTIVVLKNCTIPEGNYTIPAGVTLLIPKDADQTISTPSISRILTADAPSGIFRTLTLAKDAHLDVFGTIEVGGMQSAGTEGGGGEEGIGVPTGTLGRLYMKDGSSITLNNGAILRAWGYVLGDKDEGGKYLCEIDARRGSKVFEQFQIMDWKGGTYTTGMFDGNNSNIDDPNSHKVLPINQYYIQNVEVPVKYRPGAKLAGAGSVSMYGTILNMDEAGIIGAKYTYSQDDAIFLMNDEDDSEDTWVRKYYDATTDQQVYEANNSAYLGSLVITFSGITANSREYKLPITNNFKIHLLSGQMEVTQHTELLAGSEFEINKKSTLTIPQDVNVYMYDKEDWGHYITVARTSGGACVFGSGTTVKWRPDGRPTVRRDAVTDTVKIEDTKLTISGTIDIKGKLFTTTHGATVVSTVEDAGTVIFSSDAPANSTVSQVTAMPADGTHDSNYKRIPSTSVQLQNEDGSLTKTYTDADHHAVSGQSYCFIDFNNKGEWKSLETEGCFVKDENNVYYIKPQEYVAISQGAAPQEEADHTYRDHYAGTGKIFIEMDCQWWEVTATTTPGIYHCEHPDNNTYYYYSEADGTWLEKKFKVSWVNWDGSPVNYTNKDDEEVNYYMVTYGTVPTWLSANPTHADDASHTYSFNGWMPTPAAVTADVTYVAQYEERDRMYAITFNDESDELIQLLYCKLGEIPVCTKYDAAANNKVWMTPGENPQALGAVAGNVTYKLYAKETKSSYTIRFVNWNGTELQSGSVTAGQMPTPPANPTKDSDDLHSYSFNAWNPALAAADADATYTATYTAGPRGYTVLWKNGESTIETDENVLYGTVPEYNGATPAKSGFTFVGWSPAVSAVTGEATYTAQFLENRTISNEQTISVNTEVSTITVETSGELTVNNNITLTAENLILKSTSGASGQIIPAGNKSKFNVTNAYYDLNLNIDGRHWFAFGVPWVVNLDVTPLTEVESGRTLVLGRDYEIVYYNGATRATQGAGAHCWEKVADGTHILQPGKGYMIAFAGHINTVRFAKATGTPVIFNGTVKLQNEYGDGDNNGWNGLANPMAFHAKFTDGPTVGYVHNGEEIGHDGYTECNLENKRMIVGKMVYVQVASTADVTPVQATTGEFVAAPARRTNTGKTTDKQYLSLNDYYQVSIADANEQGGSVYVLPEENKEDKYVIGHDLSHLGISDQKAQIWVFRYGTKLALNTTAPIDDVAEYALRVYAPKNGEYTITNNQSPVSDDEYVVYLTRNGEAIWNLSDGAYTTDLTSGVHKEYGLRLSARKTPAVVTGIDEAIVDANGETRKVLINNQVFIIRGNEVYTIDGQMVK